MMGWFDDNDKEEEQIQNEVAKSDDEKHVSVDTYMKTLESSSTTGTTPHRERIDFENKEEATSHWNQATTIVVSQEESEASPQPVPVVERQQPKNNNIRSGRKLVYQVGLVLLILPFLLANVLYSNVMTGSVVTILRKKEMILTQSFAETNGKRQHEQQGFASNKKQIKTSDCCILPHQTSEIRRNICRSVCFTKQACNNNNTFYPFSSPEEQAAFPQGKLLDGTTCRKMVSWDPPRNRWCFPRRIQGDLREHSLGCKTGLFANMYIFPKGKLAFCGIHKAGITQWIQFLRFHVGAKDYQSNPHHKPDVVPLLFMHLSRPVQLKILNDEMWTKAVFIRDPAERLLSAYLDRIVPLMDNPPSFADFVDYIATPNAPCPYERTDQDIIRASPGLNRCTNVHWRPQVWSCGLSEFLEMYHLVGNLNHVASQAKRLLQNVHLWDTYGQHYRIKKPQEWNGHQCKVPMPPPLQPGDKIVPGFQQLGKNISDADLYGHAKHARARFDEYYTPELLAKVKELYAMDYVLWDLVQKQGAKGAVGSEIREEFCSA